MEEEEVVFWDTTFYNQDTFGIDEGRAPVGPSSVIAEVWFRLDIDEVVHTREVYQFLDWMGDVGGCRDIMMAFFAIVFGGYVNFTSNIETMLHLYSKEALYRTDCSNNLPHPPDDESDKDSTVKVDDHEKSSENLKTHLSVHNFSDLTISGYTRIKVYIFSTFGCMNFSCNKEMKKLSDKIDASIEQQDADFDIKNIIVELKKNTFFRNNFAKSHQAKNLIG